MKITKGDFIKAVNIAKKKDKGMAEVANITGLSIADCYARYRRLSGANGMANLIKKYAKRKQKQSRDQISDVQEQQEETILA